MATRLKKWTKLVRRAAFAPKGSKLQRQRELRDYVTGLLRRGK